MTYGQPGGGRSGRPYGPPPGRPDGQPGYGQGAQQPPYGPPPQPYAPPQHQAPPGHGRRPRGERPPQPYPYADVTVQDRRRAPAGGPVHDEDERWAVPAYVGMFVSGFVAPAIVLAAKGRTSPFARFHAVQALKLFVAVFACTFIALLLAYFKGVTWIPLVLLALGVGCYLVTRAAIGANRCEWYRLPAIVAWPIFR